MNKQTEDEIETGFGEGLDFRGLTGDYLGRKESGITSFIRSIPCSNRFM